MSLKKKPCEIVEIKSQRHKLPVEIILFHMVDFKAIKNLPLNQDCTEILFVCSQRALDRMFTNGEAYAETFMPRRKEFEALLIEEIREHGKTTQNFKLQVVRNVAAKDNSAHL